MFGNGMGGFLNNLGGAMAAQPQQRFGLGDAAEYMMKQMLQQQGLRNAIDGRVNPQGMAPQMPKQYGPGSMGTQGPQRFLGQNVSTTDSYREPELGDPAYDQESMRQQVDGYATPAQKEEPLPPATPTERSIHENFKVSPEMDARTRPLMDELELLMSEPDSEEKWMRIKAIEQEIQRIRDGE